MTIKQLLQKKWFSWAYWIMFHKVYTFKRDDTIKNNIAFGNKKGMSDQRMSEKAVEISQLKNTIAEQYEDLENSNRKMELNYQGRCNWNCQSCYFDSEINNG